MEKGQHPQICQIIREKACILTPRFGAPCFPGVFKFPQVGWKLGYLGSTMAQLGDMVAGALGGLPCVYVGQPFDTVKTRLQTRPDAYSGIMQCLRRTVSAEGVAALWKGTAPAMFVSVMENAVVRFWHAAGVMLVLAGRLMGLWPCPQLFTANGTMQRLLSAFSGRTTDQLAVWENTVIGGISGIILAPFICAPEVRAPVAGT